MSRSSSSSINPLRLRSHAANNCAILPTDIRLGVSSSSAESSPLSAIVRSAKPRCYDVVALVTRDKKSILDSSSDVLHVQSHKRQCEMLLDYSQWEFHTKTNQTFVSSEAVTLSYEISTACSVSSVISKLDVYTTKQRQHSRINEKLKHKTHQQDTRPVTLNPGIALLL